MVKFREISASPSLNKVDLTIGHSKEKEQKSPKLKEMTKEEENYQKSHWKFKNNKKNLIKKPETNSFKDLKVDL